MGRYQDRERRCCTSRLHPLQEDKSKIAMARILEMDSAKAPVEPRKSCCIWSILTYLCLPSSSKVSPHFPRDQDFNEHHSLLLPLAPLGSDFPSSDIPSSPLPCSRRPLPPGCHLRSLLAPCRECLCNCCIGSLHTGSCPREGICRKGARQACRSSCRRQVCQGMLGRVGIRSNSPALGLISRVDRRYWPSPP